ncbi:MAG: P-II family nitrogen regulator [Desulfurivibrio sp.]|nr:P-II family nitrogen regulator [Desulfurivibrio sp.]
MTLHSCHKLLITVVKKGKAHQIVEASRRAGAEGGTTLLGKGTGSYEKKFFGIPVNQDKEIVFTLFDHRISEQLFTQVTTAGRLLETGQGIALVIDVPFLTGVAHYCEIDSRERQEAMDKQNGYQLVVTVINKGNAETVVAAGKRAGAEGGTILFGRGTGIHEQAKLFSIPIEPEKEVVLTLIPSAKTEAVLRAIREDSDLDQPGHGIAFVLPVERTAGIQRLAE